MKSMRLRISVVFISGCAEDPVSTDGRGVFDSFFGNDFDVRFLLIVLFYTFHIGTCAGVNFYFFACIDE